MHNDGNDGADINVEANQQEVLKTDPAMDDQQALNVGTSVIEDNDSIIAVKDGRVYN